MRMLARALAAEGGERVGRTWDLSLKVQAWALALRLSGCVLLGKLANLPGASLLCLGFAVAADCRAACERELEVTRVFGLVLWRWQVRLCPSAS